MKILRRRTQELQESKGKEDEMNEDIRIMLISDQELVLCGLRRMLEQEEDMEVAGDYFDAQEVSSKTARLRPDIVLMDIQMPEMNGIEAMRSLKRNGLDCSGNVIMLGESVDSWAEALQAGAASYLLKDVSRAELAQAIREVYWNKQSLENDECFVEEAVELVIPPPANAAWLLRFVCQLEETLHDNYDCGSIARTVGSWERGIVITITLGRSSLADLMDKLNRMPEVEKAEEAPTSKGAFFSYVNKLRVLPRLSISPSESIRVTLKELGVARQELVPVLA